MGSLLHSLFSDKIAKTSPSFSNFISMFSEFIKIVFDLKFVPTSAVTIMFAQLPVNSPAFVVVYNVLVFLEYRRKAVTSFFDSA